MTRSNCIAKYYFLSRKFLCGHLLRGREYIRLMRLDKPIGILLLLWPTLMGLWGAGNGEPNRFTVIIFILGVIVMRTAGCVINDFTDRHVDAHVARTKNRPLALKTISPQAALVIFGALILIAGLLALQLNAYTRWLAIVGLLLATCYPLMKRYTNYPQIVLALAFAWPIPMSYGALNTPWTLTSSILYLAMACWIVAYDTEYAMVDQADDIKIGVKSTAITFGKHVRVCIGIGHFSCILLLGVFGIIKHYNFGFYLALGVAGILAAYQQYLLKSTVPHNYFKAFLNNNYFGAIVFLGLYSQSNIMV